MRINRIERNGRISSTCRIKKIWMIHGIWRIETIEMTGKIKTDLDDWNDFEDRKDRWISMIRKIVGA